MREFWRSLFCVLSAGNGLGEVKEDIAMKVGVFDDKQGRERGGTTAAPAQSVHGSQGLLNDAGRAIELMPVDKLMPYPGNARKHSRKQIRQVAKSIERFGFTNPVLIDDDGQIIAGHGRVEAAKLLGMQSVPTLRLFHLSAADKRAYIIADNRLAEKAGWDRELLAIELQALIDIDFDIEITGFETGAVDIILEDAREATGKTAGPEDKAPDPLPGPAVSQPGDLWVLANHRLVCGDARNDDAYQPLMCGEKATFVFTDPPYNVRIDGHVCGSGAIRHREFVMASGEMSSEVFTGFLTTVFGRLAAHTMDGSIHDICMDWRHIDEMMTAGRAVYTELKNLCIWTKTNAGMGSFYRSQHELVFIWKSGDAAHVNNFELGQHGRNRSNVWTYAGVNSMRPGRMEELAWHPTVKPVAMVADAIKDCSRRGDLVLDPFCGSGTILIAAERTGRKARGLEIDPQYVDVAVRRWQTYSGKTAILESTGQTFEKVEEQRLASVTAAKTPAPTETDREAA
jgi:DNA modification methylase